MLGYASKQHFVKTYGVILLMALLAAAVRYFQWPQFSLQFHLAFFCEGIVLVPFIWESIRAINRKLNAVFPFERSIAIRIAIQLFLGAAVGILARFIIYVVAEPYLPFALDELFVATTWFIFIFITVGVNLGLFTQYFIERWKESLLLAERLAKEKTQVQFDNLRNQLNPHFLFNALTSLNSLIFENQSLASQFLLHLSKVYRYLLQNKEKNFVALQTEIDFIQNYIFLIETRFHQAVAIELNIPTTMREYAIVPVTLQMLIENALKHNIADRDKPLKIEIVTVGDYLMVSNNLQLRDQVTTSNKQGLENLKSLYRFLTDKPILVESTDNRFFIKIPLL